MVDRSIGRIDHNGPIIHCIKLATEDFRPARTACSRWASLHAALMLSAVRAHHKYVDPRDPGALCYVPPSLAGDRDGIDRIGDHGSTQSEVFLRDRIGYAMTGATSDKLCSVVDQQGVFDGVDAQIGRLKPMRHTSSEGRFAGAG